MTGAAITSPAGPKIKKKDKDRTYIGDVFHRLLKHKLAMAGLIILLVEVIVVVFLPMIMELDPYSIGVFGAAPSDEHILGTDASGRDIFARLVYGGRTSLYVGVVSTLISAAIGIPLGLLAGYYRGWVDVVINRIAEVFLSVPSFVLILVLVSFIGPSINSVTIVIGIMGWPRFSKILYGNVLSVREKDYVEAARAVGTKNGKIMLKYILPNAFSPVLVAFTFGIASAILQESSLSFLGMGVQAPQASWGNILYGAQSITILSSKLWIWLPAGIILMITILSINFLGDGLRDALDPKMKL